MVWENIPGWDENDLVEGFSDAIFVLDSKNSNNDVKKKKTISMWKNSL